MEVAEPFRADRVADGIGDVVRYRERGDFKGTHLEGLPVLERNEVRLVHLHDRRDRLRRHEVRKERNIGETPVERRCALNVVHVVVREEDSDDARRVESRRLHAHPDVAAAYTAVDQEDVASRFDAIRIARAAAG